MAVTEFTILTSNPGSISPALRQHIQGTLPIQKVWHQRTYLASLSDPVEAVLQQIGNSSKILVTVRWDNIETHWTWMASEENMKAMCAITEHLLTEGGSFRLLFTG
jgi:hypothetical protein